MSSIASRSAPVPLTSAAQSGPYQVSSQDIIIAVMGATGVGKSTFINIATGGGDATIGHNLLSCTQAVQAVSCRHPRSDLNVVFLDTPGFDDTHMTDADVLTAIADWLTITYERGIKLTGLLFLHRISDNRMAGTSLRNMHMFEKLCGTDALQIVVLVTTMWDEVTQKAGAEREEELRTIFWKPMIAAGSAMARFSDTYQSAWEILDRITSIRRPLQLQVEMVDEGKPLMLTTAGSALIQWLDELMAQFRAMIVAFQVRLRTIPKESNPEIAEGVLCEKLSAQHNLDLVRQQRRMITSQPAKQPRRAFFEAIKRMISSKASSPPSANVLASSTPLPNTGAPCSPPAHITTTEATLPKSQSSTSLPNSGSFQPSSVYLHDDRSMNSGIENRGRKTAVATTVLKHAKETAEIAPVPFLKGIMSLTLTVLESIEAADRTELSLSTLAKTARRFTVTIAEQMQTGEVPDDVRQALRDLSRELQEVQIVLDKIVSRGQLHRYILQPVDEQVFSTCNESIHTACELFELRCTIIVQQTLARIEARLDATPAPPVATTPPTSVSRMAPPSRRTM